MIFEPKTDFSERDISLDTLNEERRFWAKEGDSKSREFVLRGLYFAGIEFWLKIILLDPIARTRTYAFGNRRGTRSTDSSSSALVINLSSGSACHSPLNGGYGDMGFNLEQIIKM
ncbi:hypothetical protein HYS01_02795 [Candidatus Saccharibacteria bacterium]|nr:hypothetical protein [Candidatus Saccharibacteria bacterium]